MSLKFTLIFPASILSICSLFPVSKAELSDAILNGIIGLNAKEASELKYNMPQSQSNPCSARYSCTACEHYEICFSNDKEAQCCRRSLADRTWTGCWFSPLKNSFFKCEYRHKFKGQQSDCGALICSKTDQMLFEEAKITGSSCDSLKLFGLNGKAYTGVIQWDNGKDTWFK